MDGGKLALNGDLKLTSDSKKLIKKEELALVITRAMNKGHSNLDSFNTYLCIKGYFLNLQTEELVGIATEYGINAIASEII